MGEDVESGQYAARAIALAEAGLWAAIYAGAVVLFLLAFYVTARFHR